MVLKSQEDKRRGKKALTKRIPKQLQKMTIRIYISIITLHLNGLNAPINRCRVAGWIDLYVCCLQDTHFRSKDTQRLKMRGRKIFHVSWNQKKTRIAKPISDG